MPHSHDWTFLTNHSHVLVCLSRRPNCSLREIAIDVGITPRSVQRILRELEAAGYLVRERQGRSNGYRLLLDTPLRHPLEAHRTVADLLTMLTLTKPRA